MTGLKGLNDLSRKLARLGRSAGIKALRTATSKATTPTVRKIRAAAPKGKRDLHKVHTGRYVRKGFLSRSIRRRSRTNRQRGKVSVSIGVLSEAFYGVQFLDKGITVTSRRARKGAASNTIKSDRRRARKIRPYSIRGRRWFEANFVSSENQMIRDLSTHLENEITKVTRRGT